MVGSSRDVKKPVQQFPRSGHGNVSKFNGEKS